MKLKEALTLDVRKATTEQRKEAILVMRKAMYRRKTELVVLSYDKHIVSPALQALEKKYNGNISFALPQKKNYIDNPEQYANDLSHMASDMQHWLQLKTSTTTGAIDWAKNVEEANEKKFEGREFTEDEKKMMWKALNRINESDKSRTILAQKKMDSEEVYEAMQVVIEWKKSQKELEEEMIASGEAAEKPTIEVMSRDELAKAVADEPDPHRKSRMIKAWKGQQLAALLEEAQTDLSSPTDVFNAVIKMADKIDQWDDYEDTTPPTGIHD